MAQKQNSLTLEQAADRIKKRKAEAALPSPSSITLPTASQLKAGGITLPTGKEIAQRTAPLSGRITDGSPLLPLTSSVLPGTRVAEKVKGANDALPPSRLENAVVKGAATGVGKALEQKQKELSYEIMENKYPSPIPQKEGNRSTLSLMELEAKRLAAADGAKKMESVVRKAEQNEYHRDLAEKKTALEQTAFGRRDFASRVNAAKAQAGAMGLREAQKQIVADDADSPRKFYRDLLAKLRLEAEGGGLASAKVGKSDFYTEDERKIILYYGSIGDFDTLGTYLDTIRYRVNASAAEQEAKDLSSFIDEQGAVGKAIGAGVNVMSGLVSGKGLLENVSAAVDGRPIDPNADAYSGVRAGETSAEAITKDMSPAASFFTNAGLSLANMGANMALLGPAAIYNMAASTAASTSYEVKKRGGSDAQANALALVSGAATVILEKVPVDKILKAGSAGASGFKPTLKSAIVGVLKSAGAEGAEELGEEIIGRVADSIVMGDKSEYETYKRQLTANGYSAEQAERLAFYEFYLKAPLLSFAAGSLSGGVLRGGAEIGSAMQYRALHQNADAVDKAVQEAVKSMDGEKTEATKNTAESGGVQYSIGETEDGRSVAIVDSDILAEIDTSSWNKEKKEAAKKAASEALKKYKDGIVVSGIRHKVNRDSRREYTRSNDTERLYRQNKEAFSDKMRAADIASDVVIAATNWKQDGGLTHPREDSFVDFMHGDTLIASGKNKYRAVVAIGITERGESVFYDVVSMEPIDFVIKKEESSTTATTQNAIGDIHEDSTTNSISQNPEKSSEMEEDFSSDESETLDDESSALDASFDEGERVTVKAEDSVRILPTLYSERVVSSGGKIGVSQTDIAMVKRAADKLKRRLMFYAGDADENGYYDSRSRTIYLNKNGKAPLLQTFAHELVHSAETAEEYKELAEYVFSRMEEQGISRDSLREAKKDLYFRAKNLRLTDVEADAEIVAEYLAKNLLGNESAVNELAARNRSALVRLYHALKRFFARIGIAKEQTKEDEILSVFEKVLRESAKAKKNTVTENGGVVRYDLNNTLGQQLNDWLQGNGKVNGTYNGRYFELGTTPSVLIKHGAPEAPFIMYEDCVLKVTGGKHSISLDEIARLPEQLNDPILLFKGSVPNSFVALTELTDKHGNDVVVAIHVNKRHDRNVINRIASLYSKSDDFGNNRIKSYVKAQIESGNLLDASKEKAPIWFTSRGLQLPKLVQTIIDANNSISENADSVKRQFSLAEDAGADAVTAESAVSGRMTETESRSAANGKKKVSRVRSNTMQKWKVLTKAEMNLKEMASERFTYEESPEKASIELAKNRLERDFQGELDYLLKAERWGNNDVDTAMGALGALREEARRSGNYDLVYALSKKMQEEGTKSGQEIQSFAKYSRTAEKRTADAVREIETMPTVVLSRGKQKRNETLRRRLAEEEGREKVFRDLERETVLFVEESREALAGKREIVSELKSLTEEMRALPSADDRRRIADWIWRYEQTVNAAKRRLKNIQKECAALVNPDGETGRHLKETAAEMEAGIEAQEEALTEMKTALAYTGQDKVLPRLKGRFERAVDHAEQEITASEKKTARHQKTARTARKAADAGKVRIEKLNRYIDELGMTKERKEEILKRVMPLIDILEKAESAEDLRRLIRKQAEMRGTKLSRFTAKRLVNEDSYQYLKDFAEQQFRSIISDSKKTSWADAVRSFRYLSMLSSVKTVERNLLGNGIFSLTENMIVDNAAVIFDAVFSTATKTKTIRFNTWVGNKAWRKGFKEGGRRGFLEAALDVNPDNTKRNKWSDYGQRTFKASKGKVLTNIEKMQNYTLQAPDAAFEGAEYSKKMEDLQEAVRKGWLRKEEASEIAREEALYRTFKADSAASRLTNRMRDALNMIAIGRAADGESWAKSKKAIGLGDFLIPFTTVPSNVVSIGSIDYTPLGLAKTIVSLAKLASARKKNGGKADAKTIRLQREASLSLARSLTGTGLIAACTALAAANLIDYVDYDEDRDREELMSSEGRSGVQFNATAFDRKLNGESGEWRDGDVLMELDSIEPLNAAMYLGVGFWNTIRKEGGLELLDVPVSSLNSLFNAVMDMPAFTSLSNLFDTQKYFDKEDSEGGLFVDLAMTFARTSLSSYIPSLLRNVAYATDTSVRDTSVSEADFVGKGWVTDLAGLATKTAGYLPGARQMLPEVIDFYGRPKEYENALLNFVNSLLLAGSINVYDTNEVSQEFERLWKETGSSAAYPDQTVPSSFKMNGVKYGLTSEEKRTLQTNRGALVYYYDQLTLNDGRYKRLSAEDQMEWLAMAKNVAQDQAKRAWWESRGYDPDDYPTKTYNAYEEAAAEGVSFNDFYYYKYLVSEAEKVNNESKMNSILNGEFEEETKVKLLMLSTTSDNKEEAHQEALKNGVHIDTLAAFVRELSRIDQSGASNRKELAVAYIHQLPISRAEKDELYLIEYSYKTLDDAPWNAFGSSKASGLVAEKKSLYKGSTEQKSLYKGSTAQKSLYKTK